MQAYYHLKDPCPAKRLDEKKSAVWKHVALGLQTLLIGSSNKMIPMPMDGDLCVSIFVGEMPWHELSCTSADLLSMIRNDDPAQHIPNQIALQAAILSLKVMHLQSHDLLLNASRGTTRGMYLPKFDGLVICGQKHSGSTRRIAPPHFVDLLFNFQALEVIKFWLMGLEFCEISVLKWANAGCSAWRLPAVNRRRTLQHSRLHIRQQQLLQQKVQAAANLKCFIQKVLLDSSWQQVTFALLMPVKAWLTSHIHESSAVAQQNNVS